MEAAKELRQVAKLVDSATGLGEGEGDRVDQSVESSNIPVLPNSN